MRVQCSDDFDCNQGYKCREAPECRGDRGQFPNDDCEFVRTACGAACTGVRVATYCMQSGGQCASQKDCDANNGEKCYGFRNDEQGNCVIYQSP